MGVVGRLGGRIIKKECLGQPFTCAPPPTWWPHFTSWTPPNYRLSPSPVFKERVSSAFLACSKALKLRVGIF